MTKKTCNDNCNSEEKEIIDYGFYSNVLKKPFENLAELRRAEEVYFAEQKAKEDKVAQKKADALKVEDAFRALNAARKTYKEDLAAITHEYSENLSKLKANFEEARDEVKEALATAEEAYQLALKAFTEKYPEGYHITLKDGDFETTISHNENRKVIGNNDIFDIFKWLF